MNFVTTEGIFILFGLIFLVAFITIFFLAAQIIGKAFKNQTRLKKCPFCAEMIQSETIVCRFCGRDLHWFLSIGASNKMKNPFARDFNRRKFLPSVGKGFVIMALSSVTVALLFENLNAATRKVEHLSPKQTAVDEDFWAKIQESFFFEALRMN